MKRLHYTTAFKKDYKAALKRGWNVDELLKIIDLLAKGSVLPKRYKSHRLHGQWHNFFECHINPDWLLIWSLDRDYVYLTRSVSHSDLF